MSCPLYTTVRRYLSKHYDCRIASIEEQEMMKAFSDINCNEEGVCKASLK